MSIKSAIQVDVHTSIFHHTNSHTSKLLAATSSSQYLSKRTVNLVHKDKAK